MFGSGTCILSRIGTELLDALLQIEAALTDCLGQPGLLRAISLQLQQRAGLPHVSEAVENIDESANTQLPSIDLVAPDGQVKPASVAASSSHQSTVLAGNREESLPKLGLSVSESNGTLLTQPSAEHSVAALEPAAGQQATESPGDSSESEYVRPRTILRSKARYKADPWPEKVKAVVGEAKRSEAAAAAIQGPAWQSSQPPTWQSGQPPAWQSGQPPAWQSGQPPAAAAPVPDTGSSNSRNGSWGKVPSLAEELRSAAEQKRQRSQKQRAAANGIEIRRRQGPAGQSSPAGAAQAVAWSEEQSGVQSGAATADDRPAAVGGAVSMDDAAVAVPASDAAWRGSTAASKRDATRIARAVAAVGHDDSSDEEDNLVTREPTFQLHLSGQVRAFKAASRSQSLWQILTDLPLRHSNLCPISSCPPPRRQALEIPLILLSVAGFTAQGVARILGRG